MSVTPEDLLAYARKLCGPLSTEVVLRASVSRSYYAAFHWCSAAADRYCEPLPASALKVGMNERVYVRLSSCSRNPNLEGKLRLLAEQAKKLRDLRTKADYSLQVKVDNRDATHGLGLAAQVQRQFLAL